MTSSNHFRSSPPAAHVRVLCISEPDRALNPLELQEDFVEICRSDFVEIYEKGEIDVRFGGNVIQVKSIKYECSRIWLKAVVPNRDALNSSKGSAKYLT